jgi:hypothetical protein
MDDITRTTNGDPNLGEWVPLFGDWRDEVLFDSVAMALAESGKVLRKECRDELTAAIHKLELQLAESPWRVEGHARGPARGQRRRAAAFGLGAGCSLTRAASPSATASPRCKCPPSWPT